MALQNPITLDSGLSVSEAYIKIVRAVYTTSELVVTLEWYANAQARADLKAPLLLREYSISWTDSPSLQYCYNQLKTLPEFAGAIDC